MAYERGDIFRLGGRGSMAFYLGPNRGWDDKHNEKLGQDSSFMYLAEGFFEAGAELAETCRENRGKLDFKFYPLVYLYWHGVELALKQLTRWRAELRGEALDPGKPTGHSILQLWDELRPTLADFVLDDRGMAIPRPVFGIEEVDRVLRDLADLDPAGFSFRYPKTTKGKALLSDVEAVGVESACGTLVALGETFVAWMSAASVVVEETRFGRYLRDQKK